MNLTNELDLATRAAHKAAQALRSRTDLAESDIRCASQRDVKLHSDLIAEECILRELSTTPYPILTEETGTHGTLDSDKPFWIVDPLDGSINFNRGIPLSCVSIALWLGDKPLLGVIHDQNHSETFTGIPGQGAWLNGSPIHVSRITKSTDAILASGFPSQWQLSNENLQRFTTTFRSFKKTRLLGSAALMLVWVACGRFDAYSEDSIMLWDVAAGIAILDGAGGHWSITPPGHPWRVNARASATPELLHALPPSDAISCPPAT